MKKAYTYRQPPEWAFTPKLLLEEIVLHIRGEGVPDLIIMDAKDFIEMCYCTEQFIHKPTFLGIPVTIKHKKPVEGEGI